MREKSFYFLPLKPKVGREQNDFFPYLKITKQGTAMFGKKTLEKLKISNNVFIRLFEDTSKRALGFQISKIGGSKDDGYRYLVIKKSTSSSCFAIISILSFLNKLTNVSLPSERLEIKEYNDTDPEIGIGKIFYVKIPYGKEKESKFII